MNWITSVVRETTSISSFKKKTHKKLKFPNAAGKPLPNIIHTKIRHNCILNYDIYRSNFIPSPNCECGLQKDTYHFVFVCNRYINAKFSMTIWVIYYLWTASVLLMFIYYCRVMNLFLKRKYEAFCYWSELHNYMHVILVVLIIILLQITMQSLNCNNVNDRHYNSILPLLLFLTLVNIKIVTYTLYGICDCTSFKGEDYLNFETCIQIGNPFV